MAVKATAPGASARQGPTPSASLLQRVLAHDRLLEGLLLVAITVVAGVLRFYKLGAWSFWGDEMLSVAGVADGFNEGLLRQSLALVLIQATVGALGVSEWSARLVPALIGVLSVPALFLPIRRLFDAPTALVASLLLALSPWHLYWSQNARFYGLLLLLHALAVLLFYLGLEEDRPAFLVGSLFLVALAARERPLALFFVPIAGSYGLLLRFLPFGLPRGFRPRNLAIFLVPGLIGTLLFAGPYVLDLPQWLAGFGRVNNNPLWLMTGVAFYVRVSVIGFAVAGALYLAARRHRAALLLTLWLGIPLLTIGVLSLFQYTANRYVFLSLPAWLILASVAAVALVRHAPRRMWPLVAGVLLVLLLDLGGEDVLYYRYQHGNRDNWRAAFDVVRQHRAPGETVVSAHRQIGEYYLQDEVRSIKAETIERLQHSDDRVWIVEDMNVAPLYPDFHRWLTTHAHLVAVEDVHVQARTFTMRVYLYDPAFPPPPLPRQP